MGFGIGEAHVSGGDDADDMFGFDAAADRDNGDVEDDEYDSAADSDYEPDESEGDDDDDNDDDDYVDDTDRRKFSKPSERSHQEKRQLASHMRLQRQVNLTQAIARKSKIDRDRERQTVTETEKEIQG